MKSWVRPELPTASIGSSQAPSAAVDNSAPFATCPESTYKSGKTVQTSGATSLDGGAGIDTASYDSTPLANGGINALPSAGERDFYVGLLQGSGGTMTQAELLILAANADSNAVNIDLVALQQSGVEFV